MFGMTTLPGIAKVKPSKIESRQHGHTLEISIRAKPRLSSVGERREAGAFRLHQLAIWRRKAGLQSDS